MAVTVTPQQFTFVDYDAATIERVVADLATKLGITSDIAVEVDETSPLARVTVVSDGDTITIRADSGALEDTKRLRQLSERAVCTSLGRVLLRVRDRASGRFGDAPPDAELTLRLHRLAWKTDQHAPKLTQFSVLVTLTLGPFRLRREYLAPADDPKRESVILHR